MQDPHIVDDDELYCGMGLVSSHASQFDDLVLGHGLVLSRVLQFVNDDKFLGAISQDPGKQLPVGALHPDTIV